MTDQWTIQGAEFGNCNCDWGCPCQFGSPTTHGHCEAVVGGIIDKGNFNDVSLDGLKWSFVAQWPGEISAGDGRQQIIIDEGADEAQREALEKIIHGESTAPGSTHFFVYNSTMSEVLPTLFLPIEISIDVDARQGRIQIPGMVDVVGTPIIHPVSGEPHSAQIHLPNGFEYTTAEMGSGTATVNVGGIELNLKDSYGQFNILHMNQDGVIR